MSRVSITVLVLEKTVEDKEGPFSGSKQLAVLRKISSGSKSVRVSLQPEPELQRMTKAPLCCLCCHWLKGDKRDSQWNDRNKNTNSISVQAFFWPRTYLLCVSSREPPCTPARALQLSWQQPAHWSSPPACFGGLKHRIKHKKNNPTIHSCLTQPQKHMHEGMQHMRCANFITCRRW